MLANSGIMDVESAQARRPQRRSAARETSGLGEAATPAHLAVITSRDRMQDSGQSLESTLGVFVNVQAATT